MRRAAARAGAAALAAAAAVATTAAAAGPLPVPAQGDWNQARRTVTTADGIALAYVEMGVPGGVPVILLHGYTDNSRSWSLIAPHLAGRHLFALDLRGHGASAKPACCYGLDVLARDLEGFMDALGIERADLVGHSLGSMAAAVFAATRPARVDDLVLVGAALNLPAPARDWLWENVPALAHPIDPDSPFMRDWYWNPNPVDEDFLTRERAESAAVPAHVWDGVLIGLTLGDWSGLAPRIGADTLILWGGQDGLFGAAEQEALRAALPQARFEAFESLGHNLIWEEPEPLGRRIADFLAD